MKRVIILVAAGVLSFPASAQQPQNVDPHVQSAVSDQQALLNAQMHFMQSIQALMNDRAKLAEEVKMLKAKASEDAKAEKDKSEAKP